MKKLLTVVLCATASVACGQWSDTENNFYDTLHIPVCTASGSQRNPIVLTSYPDGGYFVIWEDDRNYSATKTDIYAQKFDRNGNRLWTVDGVPVCNSGNNQHYTYGSLQDYRNRSFAGTDSAGGFYITYMDDSVGNLIYNRVMVQHVLSNGTAVFPGAGYKVTQAGSTFYDFMWPQLIADGNKGFFVTYKQSYYEVIIANCYRDEGGRMVYYGGGRMNENAYQYSSIAPCGIKTDIAYPGQATYDYNIWYDGEGGCNIVMQMSANNGQGTTGPILAFNRLWRAKKDAKTLTYFRNTSGSGCPRISEYKKNDVYRLYYLVSDFQSVFCGGGSSTAYAYTNFRLLSNGYFVIDQGNALDHNFSKGVTVRTDSNINVNLIAVTRRKYENSTVSDFTIQGYAYRVEKFDSVPYERASFNNPDIGYNPTVPPKLKKLNNFRDTLLAVSSYYPDFSIAAGGNSIYISGLMTGSFNARLAKLQKLEISRKTADSFAVEYKTNFLSTPHKTGVAIGAEVSTGFGGSSISYDHPLIASTRQGRFVFYIRDYYRSARVSPIGTGAQLEWGAMGTPVGTGVYNSTGYPYNFEQPVITLDANGVSGIIAWRDNRPIAGNATAYDNIFVRHLNRLDAFNYQPPVKEVRQLYSLSTPLYSNPAILFGSSNEFSVMEGRNHEYATIPWVSIFDNNYLGTVNLQAYQHIGPPRKYNNEAFLNTNFTIKPDSLPPGAKYGLRIYFSTAAFNALKSAEITVKDPGHLAVIRQPNNTAVPPAAYSPVAGEELLSPFAWDSVKGGYYIQIEANGMGNFFIKKQATSTICSSNNASFTSNISGSSYQWQINTTGLVFVNISNTANYSGTSSPTLQINNIPSSFSGNRYRCVVNNTSASNIFALQVGNTWTGVVNNQWEIAGNWSCNTVPDANTIVIINNGMITVNSNVSCKSLLVNTGATVTVTPGFTLTVTD